MKKHLRLLFATLFTVAAAALLALPAFAAATPETAPALTDAELAYTRVSPYDELDAARIAAPAALDALEGTLDTFALDGYNTANADVVFEFLRGELGLNTAQAVGIMANMYTESRFIPTAYNGSDTGGTQSYGLCQWNSGRYDTLRSWCAANGYDYTTVEGQLRYLQYEITQTWEARILRNDSLGFSTAPDTAEGAYAAGYAWARYFERGAARYWPSRGVLAQQDFWPIYSARQTVDAAQATAFVTRLYQICLNREPDAPGLADWVNRLQTRQVSGAEAAAGFIFSSEFIAQNPCSDCYVTRLYRAFMGREPDTDGKADWLNRLAKGATRGAVFNGFAGSTEFADICQSYGITAGGGDWSNVLFVLTGNCGYCGAQNKTAADFVTRLYDVCLDRTPDTAGLADWENRLKNGVTGREVAAGFVFSDEFQRKNHSNADYVEYLYRAFLGRASDAAGKADWLARLSNGASREEVFNGFVGSDEFTAICAGYGIRRG